MHLTSIVPLSVLYVKYYPETGRYFSRWTWTTMSLLDVTTNKNTLGILAMLGGLVMMWSLLDNHMGRGPSLKCLVMVSSSS